MVIDFHAHIYPEKIAARAVYNIGEFYRLDMRGAGTAADLRERGRGIDRFVVYSAAASAAQVRSINTYIASVCGKAEDAGPVLTGFGTLHPDLEDPAAEIDRMIGLGLGGIKLHPDMQGFSIDDERMMRIYALLEGRMTVVFHCGDYRYPYSSPDRLARVLDAFPRLTVVAAHFGGWSVYDLALEYLLDRSCYLDLSSSIPYLGQRRTVELIRAYGARRILFASDYPMWDPAGALSEFLSLPLTTEERDLILYQNASGLLGL
jgi:predicted TIM-barrel fold metal-dependent hydrolase